MHVTGFFRHIYLSLSLALCYAYLMLMLCSTTDILPFRECPNQTIHKKKRREDAFLYLPAKSVLTPVCGTLSGRGCRIA